MRRFLTSKLPIISLAVALSSNALSVTNVFPYAPFQVKYFGLTQDERELGFYAGFFMSAYMIGCVLSSIPWGAVSDRTGKKFVIMVGLLSNTLPQIVFGLATSMPLALTMRLLMGLLNGTIGAAKALAPDLVPPSEQAAAMSMIAATWGFGNLIGPAMGGLLSSWHLCEHADSEHADSEHANSSAALITATPSACPAHPFLTPNVVCAVLALVGAVAIYALLPDDRRARRRATMSTTGTRVASKEATAATAVTAHAAATAHATAAAAAEGACSRAATTLAASSEDPPSCQAACHATCQLGVAPEQAPEQPDESDGATLRVGGSVMSDAMMSDACEAGGDARAVAGMAAGAAAGDACTAAGACAQPPLTKRQLARRSVALVSFYSVIAIVDIIHNEVFPLWCVAPVASGGLALDSTSVGWLLCASGGMLLLYQVRSLTPCTHQRKPHRLYTSAEASPPVHIS